MNEEVYFDTYVSLDGKYKITNVPYLLKYKGSLGNEGIVSSHTMIRLMKLKRHMFFNDFSEIDYNEQIEF